MSVETELFHRDTSNRHPLQQLADLMRDESELIRIGETTEDAHASQRSIALSRRTLHLVQSPYFPDFSKAHIASEVAANTQDEGLIKAAEAQLKKAYPTGTEDIETARRNAYSRAEYMMAIRATSSTVNFSEALIMAEIASDQEHGISHDEMLAETAPAEGSIPQRAKQDIIEPENDHEDYADTVRWSPDDDDDDPQLDKVMDKMVDDILNHHLQKTHAA
jgi:hypothetical protein